MYILHDKGKASTSERVGFTATRNLSTDDPNLAWRLMCATAMQRGALKAAAGIRRGGRETSNFCAHISLSWHPDEKPTDAEMQRAADSLLKAYGYDHLQVLMARHDDTDHSHLHLVVNLIDPVTGLTAKNVKDDFKKILQPWAYEYEKANGRIVCANRARDMEARARVVKEPANANSPADGKRQLWLPRAQWEAQRQAERDAKRQLAADLSAQHQLERRRVLDATKADIRTASAALRDKLRPDWAALYRRQRQDRRAHEKVKLELSYAAKSATARMEYVERYRDLIRSAGVGIDDLEAGVSRGRLEQAMNVVLAKQGEAMTLAHDQAFAAMKGRAGAAWHDLQRGIWKQHNERMEELRGRQTEERRAARRGVTVANDSGRAPGHAAATAQAQGKPMTPEPDSPAGIAAANAAEAARLRDQLQQIRQGRQSQDQGRRRERDRDRERDQDNEQER